MNRFGLWISLCLFALVTWVAQPASSTPPNGATKEAVEYRLEKWMASHMHDSKKAEELSNTLKKLNCEVQIAEHSGHIDVKYRCPKWQTLTLKTHDEAHKWEKWLKDRGFETKHVH